MASCHIRKRDTARGTRYDVRYRRGGRYWPVEHAGTFTSLRDARTRRELVTGWLAANLDPKVMLMSPPVSQRLSVVADDWLASRLNIGDASRANYRRHLDNAIRLLGDPVVDSITVADVRELVGVLAEKMAPGTVRQHMAVLRAALDHAELPANPARHRSIETPRSTPRDLQPPDAHELVAILSHLPFRHRGLLLVIEQTGMRVTEAIGLEPGDVDAGLLRIRRETTKTGRPRLVPCDQWLTDRLDLPFRLTRQRAWNALANAADQAGVPRYGPHQWRHRRATLWHRQGVPPVEVSRRLGHAKTSISLDVYTHARPVSEADPQVLASLLM